jgi:uncharacterized membrane-anchored protein YhcB (DUF1043 family)
MLWIIGSVCFLSGGIAGILASRLFGSDEVRVQHLQELINELTAKHENYKQDVHSHFTDTADLINTLNDSYRDVYLHLAKGAHDFCPEHVSEQLQLSAAAKAILHRDKNASSEETYQPPRDYADKGEKKVSTLAENYGLHQTDETST